MGQKQAREPRDHLDDFTGRVMGGGFEVGTGLVQAGFAIRSQALEA